MTDLQTTESGLFIPRGTSIQPITDDYSTDGLLDEFARIDHQHPLSPSLRAAIFGAETASIVGRNLIDNGAMNIWQRAVITPAYTTSLQNLDRWGHGLLTLGTFTWAQVVDAPVNSGLTKSSKLICTVANAAPAAAAESHIQQAIEGQFVQHLLWGTSVAKPITLSFWVKSSLVGTYICEVQSISASARYISAAYTINVANTWEYKTVTFPGDTVNVITNDNAARVYLLFWTGAGTNFTGGGILQTAWGTTVNNRVVGQVNLSATINNAIQFTGVQLEVGNKASPFEFRRFDDELRKAQRYLWSSFTYGAAFAQNSNDVNGQWLSTHFNNGAGAGTTKGYHRLIPPLRANPGTVTSYNPGAANANFRNSAGTLDYAINAITSTADGLDFRAAAVAAGEFAKIHLVALAEI